MNSALVTAMQLEEMGVMKKSTAYKMAKLKILAHYRTGCVGGGIRFKLDEVLAAMKVSATTK